MSWFFGNNKPNPFREMSPDKHSLINQLKGTITGNKRKEESDSESDPENYRPQSFAKIGDDSLDYDSEGELTNIPTAMLTAPLKAITAVAKAPYNARDAYLSAMFNPTDYGVTLNQSKPTITAIPGLPKNSFLSQPTGEKRQIVYDQLMEELTSKIQQTFSDQLLDNIKFNMLTNILKIPLEEPIAVIVVGKIDGRVRMVDIITLSLSINTTLRDANGTLVPSFDMEMYGFNKNQSTNTLEAVEYGALIRFDLDKILPEHVGTAYNLTEKTFTEILFDNLFGISNNKDRPYTPAEEQKLKEYMDNNKFFLYRINQDLGTHVVAKNIMSSTNQQNIITKPDIIANLLNPISFDKNPSILPLTMRVLIFDINPSF
jgi:hypothetical protein